MPDAQSPPTDPQVSTSLGPLGAELAEGERFLMDASARLAQSLDVHATIRTLGDLAVESFADGCRVTLVDETAAARGDYPFVHVAVTSRSPEHATLAREIQDRWPIAVDAPGGFPYVIRTGVAQLTPEAAFTSETLAWLATGPDHLDLLQQLDVRSAVIAPIIARGRVLGALTLVRHGPEPRPAYTARDLWVAEELGRRAGTALDNAQLYAAEQLARSAAERSEAQLTDVLDSMVEAFYAYDRDWRFLRINRAARAVFERAGLSSRQVIGHVLWELVPALVGTEYDRVMRRVMETRVPERFVTRDLAGDGWLEVRVMPTSEGLAAYSHDVTARVLADQQRDLLVRLGETMTGSLDPERTLDAIARAPLPDFADYTIVDILDSDGTVRRVAGAHADPSQAERLACVLARAPRIDSENFVARVLRSGHAMVAPETTEAELQCSSDDAVFVDAVRSLGPRSHLCVPLVARQTIIGSLLLVRTSGGRPFAPSDVPLVEEIGRRAAAALDHSRLYEAEQITRAAAEREAMRVARLAALTEAVGAPLTRAAVSRIVLEQAVSAAGAIAGGMLELTPDGREFQLLDVVGYQPSIRQEYARFPVDAPVPARDALRTRRAVYLMAPSDWAAGGYRGPAKQGAPPGSTGWAALPLLIEDRVLGVLTMTFDDAARIAEPERDFLEAFARQCAQALERASLYEGERAARQAAEAASRAKGEFLAVMSHELRTPLNAIGGYAELMELGIRGPITPGQREDLQRIQRSQRHLLLLINEVLNYTRLESGAVTYDVRPTPVSDVIASTVPLVEPQRAARRLELAIVPDATRDEPLMVMADPDKLQQILLNLLSNAVKFTPLGGRVTVELVGDAGDGRAAIRVRDNGVGIPSDRLEAIFEPFVQVGRSLNNPGEGTGLGLAISRDLARGMGGELGVESELGVGSVFTLLLSCR